MVVFGIVSPMVASMCAELKIEPSKAMFPLGIAGVATCGILPIGAGASAFAQYNGFLEIYEYTTYQFNVLNTVKARFPVLVVIAVYLIFLAPRLAPDHCSVEPAMQAGRGMKEQKPLDPVREVLAYGIFLLVTLGLIFQKYTGLENWEICVFGAVAMVLTGILSEKEAVDAMPIWMYLLYVGSLFLGTGLVNTRTGTIVGDAVASLAANTTNGYLIGAIFFTIPSIVTQFKQNRTVTQIFQPICILACKSLGCSPIGPVLLVASAALCANLTPPATGTVPLMMAADGYTIKDLFKQGWLPALIIGAVSIFWTMTVFPAFPG